MIKKTLLCMTIGMLSFYVGILVNEFFQAKPKVVSSAAYEPERIFGTNDEFNGCGFGSSETIIFSVIEGDYDSQQDSNYWMYLYSTVENGESIVAGDIRVRSKIYDIKSNNPFNPITGELSFNTEKIGKVSYKFSGKVFRKTYKDGESVLEGKLEKFKNGKIIEVSKHKFKFYFHVCSQ